MGLLQRIRIVFLPDLSLQTGMPCVSQALWHTLPSRPSVGWDVTVACPTTKKNNPKHMPFLRIKGKNQWSEIALLLSWTCWRSPKPKVFTSNSTCSKSQILICKWINCKRGINVGHNQPCQIIANPRNWTLSGGESRSSIWHVFADNITISS